MLEQNDISKEEALSFLPLNFVKLFSPVLSLKSILHLINEHGGESIYISNPDQAKAGSLSGMSEKDIHAICGLASGCIIEIPSGAKLRLHMRNKEIIRLADHGAHYNAIARQYDITQRHVRKIIKKSRSMQ